MRSGIALFVLALLATTSARAQPAPPPPPVPIAVAPFSVRCFDAATLAEHVRTRVDSGVTVGAPPRGSHQEVRVVEHGRDLSVQVTARDQRGAVVGSARHVVPADDCAAALEVATLIVARAALPLTAVEPRARKPHPQKPEPVEPPPPPVVEQAKPEPPPKPAPLPPPPKPQVIIIEKPVPSPPAPLPAGSVLVRLRGPEHRWVGELSAAVYGAFALDGNGTDQPAGELALGFRRGRFGAALRGDVEGDFTVAAPPTASMPSTAIKLDIRRAQLALEAHADVPIRVGALRFVLGPTMPLWSVRPSGVAHPSTDFIVSVGLTARILYRLDIGRVFLAAGVTFDAALWREQLSLTGIGLIARTPLFEVGPILGFGVNL